MFNILLALSLIIQVISSDAYGAPAKDCGATFGSLPSETQASASKSDPASAAAPAVASADKSSLSLETTAQAPIINTIPEELRALADNTIALTLKEGTPRNFISRAAPADLKVNMIYLKLLQSLTSSSMFLSVVKAAISNSNLLSLDTASLRVASAQYIYGWFHNEKSDAELLRFIELNRLQAARDAGFMTVDLYGNRQIDDWAAMNRYLNDIPSKKIKFSLGFISQAHSVGLKNYLKWLQPLGKTVLRGNAFAPGVLKSPEFNLRAPIKFSKWTQAQFDQLSSIYDQIQKYQIFQTRPNECLECKKIKIHDVVRAADGTLSGHFYYPGGTETERMVTDLSDWANREMEKIDLGKSTALDPIELAAVFQYALVYIHPYVEGNGRLSRALKDRILLKYFLAPDLRLPNLNEDLSLPLTEHILQTRLGIRSMIAYYNDQKKILNFGSPVNQVYFGLDTAAVKKVSANGETLTYRSTLVGTNGNQIHLELHPSGLLMDANGVPYIFDRKNNSVVPISDKSLLIYANPPNSSITETPLTSEALKAIGPEDMSQEQRDVTEDSVKLLELESSDREKIKVLSYDPLSKANIEGDFYFQPQQREHLLSYLRYQLDPKFNGLRFVIGKRFSDTAGETQIQASVFNKKKSLGWNATIAHYEIRDFYLYELELSIQKYNPELKAEILPLVRQLRKKLHSEVRKMVDSYLRILFEAFDKPYEHEFNNPLGDSPRILSIPLKESIRESVRYRLKFTQLAESKLRYKSFDEALQKIDDSKVIVVRVAAPNLEREGLIPPYKFVKWLEKFPKIKSFYIDLYSRVHLPKDQQPNSEPAKFTTFVMNVLNRIDTSKLEKVKAAMTEIQNRLSKSPADFYGFDNEYRRMFTELTLHTRDDFSTNFISTSVSMFVATFLNDSKDNLHYSNLRASNPKPSMVYVFRVSKKDLERFPSKYAAEHELSLTRTLDPLTFRRSLVMKATSQEVVADAAKPIFKPITPEETAVRKVLQVGFELLD